MLVIETFSGGERSGSSYPMDVTKNENEFSNSILRIISVLRIPNSKGLLF
jgi:hypothetical protein